MSKTPNEPPTVLLQDAELLYVTLATVTHVLKTRTNYPVNNLLSVIGAYLESRDAHLKATGVPPEVAANYTNAAVDALLEWLDNRESNTDNEDDFRKWAGEMLE